MQYRHVETIGGKGDGPGRFAGTLCGIAVAGPDQVYAAGDSAVKVYDGRGASLRQWGTSRPALAVAVDADGSVWVGEAGQIEIFDSEGRIKDRWIDEERLGRVTAIGFLGDSVLAGDSKARCIRRFGRDGGFLNNIGDDNRRHGLLIPNGAVDFSVDSAGVIHAANPGKHRVERYTLKGELLGHIGRFGGLDPAGFSGCCNPTNVTLGDGDRIYVTEKAGPRAKVYSPDGELLSVIATDAFEAACKNMDIAVGAEGRVYVADTVKLEILVFEAAAPGDERSGQQA
jgi:sugar lactone lactonase YvrE